MDERSDIRRLASSLFFGHQTRSRASLERGFTLLEMLIALVLVGLLLAVVGTVLTRSFSETGQAQQQRKAMQQMRTTMSQFGNDLRVARAPDRNPLYVGNGNDLGSALLSDTQLKVQLPGETAPRTLDVRDVVEATGSSFTFRADVDSAVGVECVRYFVDPDSRALVRSVLTYDQALSSCRMSPELQHQELVQELKETK